MAIDEIDTRMEVGEMVLEFAEENRKMMHNELGIFSTLYGSFAQWRYFHLIFDMQAYFVNHHFVTADVPNETDVETIWETSAVKNIKHIMDHPEDKDSLPYRALLNGLCITDFGGDGAVFLSMPQMPPRQTDVTIHGKIATLPKIAFEKYFLHKIQTGDTDPYYEKYMLHLLGVDRVALNAKITK